MSKLGTISDLSEMDNNQAKTKITPRHLDRGLSFSTGLGAKDTKDETNVSRSNSAVYYVKPKDLKAAET